MQYKYILMALLIVVGLFNIFASSSYVVGGILIVLGLLAPVIYPRIEAAMNKNK